MSKNYYKPLPSYLRINDSKIHGQGLFTAEDIDKNHNIGISHYFNEGSQDGYIRNCLGGFVNYSDTPNCKLVDNGKTLSLVTRKKIEAGEELTLKYHLYNPTI